MDRQQMRRSRTRDQELHETNWPIGRRSEAMSCLPCPALQAQVAANPLKKRFLRFSLDDPAEPDGGDAAVLECHLYRNVWAYPLAPFFGLHLPKARGVHPAPFSIRSFVAWRPAENRIHFR